MDYDFVKQNGGGLDLHAESDSSTTTTTIDANFSNVESEQISIQVFVPDFNIQKCWQFRLDDTVWHLKRIILDSLPKDLREGFNFGLFLPPCNGRAGKFLSEERPLRDYPFQDCVPYLEFKYKKRVYKMMNIDEKVLKQLHTKNGFKKFLELVETKNVEKIEKLCSQGFDPNFHALNGETPLTIAASTPNNKSLILALVSGGAHLDFRSMDGQTPLHKAACLPGPENVEILLSLGSSPNFRDQLNLTPLYYSTLKPTSSAQIAEILLRDYSEVGVEDAHGNQEIHQACKNGLVGHLEHLLYYNADINHRNVNGNTPLHVCAVNNQDSCARLLLFRGADPSIFNNQGQTAYHIATITGHVPVAEVIKSNVALNAVPYRGQPRYNSKRRFTLCRSQIGSKIPNSDYGTLRRMSTASVSSTPSFSTMTQTGNSSHYSQIYGTRTMPSEIRPSFVQALRDSMAPNSESTLGSNATTPLVPTCNRNVSDDVNIPRILVIPRGKKGFGFILRGAKKVDPGMNFQPTLEIPALQYFEGVDTNGMAMKAGLRPGDFLLEINNIDVRCANHDQVVRLIQMASETITLKVITVDLSAPCPHSFYATVHRGAIKPANIAYRSPRRTVQSLSQASGRASVQYYGQCETYAVPPNFNFLSKSVENIPIALRDPSSGNKVASVRNRPAAGRRVPINEIEQMMQRHNGGFGNMLSTSFDDSPGTPQARRNDPPASPGPKVYASVAEMKRQKKQGRLHMRSSSGSNILTLRVGDDDLAESELAFGPGSATSSLGQITEHTPQPCEFDPSSAFRHLMLGGNFNLSRNYCAGEEDEGPSKGYVHQMELNRHWLDDMPHSSLWNVGNGRNIETSNFYPEQDKIPRRASAGFNQPLKATYARPRVSPPPPPVRKSQYEQANFGDSMQHQLRKASSKPDLRSGAVPVRTLSSASLAVPAPKPTPIPNAPPLPPQASFLAVNKQKPVASFEPLMTASDDFLKQKPTTNNDSDVESDLSFKRALAQRRAALSGKNDGEVKNEADETNNGHGQKSTDLGSKPLISASNGSGNNFEADLKSAIARRRNQLEKNLTGACETWKPAPAAKPVSAQTGNDHENFNVQHFGTSLKESVVNNMQKTGLSTTISVNGKTGYSESFVSVRVNNTNNNNNHVSSFGKKDSGYTSSRNSLEPSECGEDNETIGFVRGPSNGQQFANKAQNDLLKQNRVSVLSQQLEENMSGLSPRVRSPHLANGQFRMAQSCAKNSEQDSMSLASTLSSSMSVGSGDGSSTNAGSAENNCLQSNNQPSFSNRVDSCGGFPEVPPPDYDQVDSGTGESDGDETTADTGHFSTKLLTKWTKSDVFDWLDSMRMGEYKNSFSCALVDGKRLFCCDRAEFTKLGVTRVAHRIAMENSLKQYKQAE